MSQQPLAIPPESKDWTVVLTEGCAECGFEPYDPADSAARLYAVNAFWPTALAGDDAHDRPSPRVWSPIEYAAHARDMVRLLGDRVRSMLESDDPVFEDWDGDAKAVELAYGKADRQALLADLTAVTQDTARVLLDVDEQGESAWARTGRRSDGVSFTVATLAQYLVHDVEHHLGDVIGNR